MSKLSRPLLLLSFFSVATLFLLTACGEGARQADAPGPAQETPAPAEEVEEPERAASLFPGDP